MNQNNPGNPLAGFNADDLMIARAAFLQKLRDWGEPLAKDKKCPNCGGSKWHVPPEVVQIRRYGDSGGSGIPVYPYIQVGCIECGYTEFYNAVFIGLIPPSDQKPGN